MKKLLSVLAVSAAVMAPAAFASSPVMFSTINGFNAPDSDAVGGVRLALLHGQVNDLKGVDLAVVGMSETQTTTGVNLGIFGASKVNQEMTGASCLLYTSPSPRDLRASRMPSSA